MTNAELYRDIPPISLTLKECRLRFSGQICRYKNEVFWNPPHGERSRGHPATTYIDQLDCDTGLPRCTKCQTWASTLDWVIVIKGTKKNANNSSGIQTFVFYLGWVLSQLLVEYLSCVVICCCIDCTIRACRAWFRVRRGEGYWLIEHIRLVGIQGILPQEILKFKPSEMTGSASCGDGGVKPPLPAPPAAQSLIIMPMLVSPDLS